MVFAMRVTKVIPYEQYWNDPCFQAKKPNLDGFLEDACGDNMYPERECPVPAFHCKTQEIKSDNNSPWVLISDEFVYYGGSEDAPLVPQFCQGEMCCPKWCGDQVCCDRQGHKSVMFCQKTVERVITWIRSLGDTGVCGKPLDLKRAEKLRTEAKKQTPSRIALVG